ncbi:LysR family transcriptional regulator [Vibrio splendidus]
MKHSDFSLIPIFVAIIEERSFSGAAIRLGLSQSAISQSASRLKKLFNDPLFIRESHGITPSKLAIGIYPTLAAAVENIKLTTPNYHTFDPMTCERQFSISAPSAFGLIYLPIVSRLIAESAPLVSVKGEAHVNEEETAHLLRNHYDLTLDIDYGQYPQLNSESIVQSGLCVLASKNHPRIRGTRISSTEYLREKHVAHTVPSKNKAYLLHKGLSADHVLIQRKIAWYANNIAEMLPIIEQTDYLGLFPKILIEKYFPDANLKTITCDFLSEHLSISMFWHPSRSNDPAHQWLREIFLEAAKQFVPHTENEVD